MSRRSVETKSLIGIISSAGLDDAARVLSDKDIGALGVYAPNARDLVGVVTERDLSHAIAHGLDPAKTRVSEVMTTPVLVAQDPVTSTEAARLMKERHVRHLIVKCGDSDRIVSIRDV